MGRKSHHRSSDDLGRGLRMVHVDADLLVVEKPLGMLSARIGQSADVPSVFDLVRQYATRMGGRPRATPRGDRRRQRVAWIIHRLDRDVSGLMVFALSEPAYHFLKDDLAARRVVRRYAAVVDGTLPVDARDAAWHGVSSFLIDRGPGRSVAVIHEQAGAGDRRAEHAVTYYRCVACGRGRSLVEVRLQTGRKHQIRAHMTSLGHPIAGDHLYQPDQPATAPRRRIMLHAAELRLRHPATGREVGWVSPPPTIFTRLIGLPAKVWPVTGLMDSSLDSPSVADEQPGGR